MKLWTSNFDWFQGSNWGQERNPHFWFEMLLGVEMFTGQNEVVSGEKALPLYSLFVNLNEQKEKNNPFQMTSKLYFQTF